MNFDLDMVRNCPSDTHILRFYGWTPYCISLGSNQPFEDIDQGKAKNDNIDIVKRPTGGRAILHAEELTYSVVFPDDINFGGKKIYELISKSIVMGLKLYHSRLTEVELETQQPKFSELLKQPSGAVCFASASKSEIKYKDKKLVGSAQRKIGSKILQHGSILIGRKHRELVNYLSIESEHKNKIQSEIIKNTIELESIIGREIDLIRLQSSIISGFEEYLGATFLCESLETF
ncbi:MAG: hypothetical protein R3250_01725 [Melioribacteraceae bacterium]|nr:hypothetical protein [Melioribacteraceae bacterium]